MACCSKSARQRGQHNRIAPLRRRPSQGIIEDSLHRQSNLKMSCSNQKKRQRKEVEWVDFEIIKTDNREEMVDNGAVERGAGVYSRFHLAANQGWGRFGQTGYRLTQIDWSNAHHSKGVFIEPQSYFQIEGVYELQPHNPRDTEIYRLDYSTQITNRHSRPKKGFENCEPHTHKWHRKGMYSKGEALCYLLSVPKGHQLRRLILFMTQEELVPVKARTLYALVATYRKDDEVRHKLGSHRSKEFKYSIKGNDWSCNSGDDLVILPFSVEDSIDYKFAKKVRVSALPGSSSSEVKVVVKTSRTVPKNRHRMKSLKAADTPNKKRLIGIRCWKGQLFLPILPYWDGNVPDSSANLDKDVYFQDIVDYFGDCSLRDHNGDDRMYFTRFDPPENREHGRYFFVSKFHQVKLREFITKSSIDQCGLVISSKGGSKRADRHVWFGCRSCIFDDPSKKKRKAEKATSNCPFGFQLRSLG